MSFARALIALAIVAGLAPQLARAAVNAAWLSNGSNTAQGVFVRGRDGCVIVTARHLGPPGVPIAYVGPHGHGATFIKYSSLSNVPEDHAFAITAPISDNTDCFDPPSRSEVDTALQAPQGVILRRNEVGVVDPIPVSPGPLFYPVFTVDSLRLAMAGVSGAPIVFDHVLVGIAVQGAPPQPDKTTIVLRIDEIAARSDGRLTYVEPKFTPNDISILPQEVQTVVLEARRNRELAEAAARRARETRALAEDAKRRAIAGDDKDHYRSLSAKNKESTATTDAAGSVSFDSKGNYNLDGYGWLKITSGPSNGDEFFCKYVWSRESGISFGEGDCVCVYDLNPANLKNWDRWEGGMNNKSDVIGPGIIYFKDGRVIYENAGTSEGYVSIESDGRVFEGRMADGLAVVWNKDGGLIDCGEFKGYKLIRSRCMNTTAGSH